VYTSVSPTNPAGLFGGTWVELVLGTAIAITPPTPTAVDLHYWQRTA